MRYKIRFMEPRVSIITLVVKDLGRSLRFYPDGLGFPTTRSRDIIFFQMQGTCLALYPYEALAEDVSKEFTVPRSKFSGITLAHSARTREDVDTVLKKAELAGAKIQKVPGETDWGG